MDQSQLQGQVTGTVVNTVVDNTNPTVMAQGTQLVNSAVSNVQSVQQSQVVQEVQNAQVDQNVSQVASPQPVQPQVINTKKKDAGATSFVVYLFQFIVLGIVSFFKNGTNMFNANNMIDSGEETEQQKSSKAKIAQRIELRKQAIRNNPKYIEMKQALSSQLAAESGKKYETPVVFQYTCMNPEGKIVTGKFNGVSKLDVNAFLLNEGMEVYAIETSDYLNFVYGQSKITGIKMSTKDLIFWLTQLSTYLKAGIPLADAVRILADQMSHGRENSKTQIFKAICYELSMGTAFSKTLEKQGNVFPSLLINMLKAAEATGDLEQTLDEMAAYYTEVNDTKQQMKSSMTYPILVMVFAIGIVVFILSYIVPKFVDIYESAGVTLSSTTQFLIDLSGFLQNYLLLILAVIILAIVSIVVVYKNVQPVRRVMQIAVMHLPLFGQIIIYNEITLFTKTFASLLKNNVYITESIDILSKVTSNEIYKEIMFNTIRNIARGDKISDSFKDQWAVPEIAYFMIQTGESTGDLANMMQKVSEYYAGLHKSMINSMKAFIEPAMIGFIAVVVGGILVAVIMPMFDLYENISM